MDNYSKFSERKTVEKKQKQTAASTMENRVVRKVNTQERSSNNMQSTTFQSKHSKDSILLKLPEV